MALTDGVACGVLSLSGPAAPFPLNPAGYGDRPDWAPFPDPLVTSRDGEIGPAKTAVAALEAMAAGYGWTAVVTYAKGYTMHARTGLPGAEPRSSLAVRMARADRRAVAVYLEGPSSWAWGSFYEWRLGEFPNMPGSLTEFQAMVFGPVHGPTLKDAGLGPMLGPRLPTAAERKAAALELVA